MLRLPAGRQAQCTANKVFSDFRVFASMVYRWLRSTRMTFAKSGVCAKMKRPVVSACDVMHPGRACSGY